MTGTTPEPKVAYTAPAGTASKLLVALTPMSGEALETMLSRLSLAFINNPVTVALADLSPEAADSLGRDFANLRLLSASVKAASAGSWLLSAADFVNLHGSIRESGAGAFLLLGPEAQTLSVEAIRALASAISGGADLAVPHYAIGPLEGLVNSALLYPVSRAIFGGQARFPLAVDLGMSARMVERIATTAQKFTSLNQNDALMWPVSEASSAGFAIVEVEAGLRVLPQPSGGDLNAILAQVGSSLFSWVETSAAFWQRSRVPSHTPRPLSKSKPGEDEFPDVQPMIEAFHVAYQNLHELWSLVLPPISLLALKRLSQAPAESFRMGDAIWARAVYDFILAYRLRTINRGHLLGALTPLYLAWVASHILLARSGVDPEAHIDEVVREFETNKAYLVSRWRWPDRFNP